MSEPGISLLSCLFLIFFYSLSLDHAWPRSAPASSVVAPSLPAPAATAATAGSQLPSSVDAASLSQLVGVEVGFAPGRSALPAPGVDAYFQALAPRFQQHSAQVPLFVFHGQQPLLANTGTESLLLLLIPLLRPGFSHTCLMTMPGISTRHARRLGSASGHSHP